ncbi:hypothetical protein N473_13370 [Pseudoalteromonas luteoviolacea CPMOR-1]|uniref:DUF58 domain-containing protein n=1 Tax=Pseudoalteromonas luteoviolacea CPMOR-1 TaxID=1365248 RepID=A0A167LLA2_9GAMM|nr:DUF58 domain-containing protein [Pseudoalteromonas luteoviolacea]KZN64777.1 hypothetical protein N473_13370 [Pseudoalteromonas luteoviolacea CPMOR-1]
MKANIDIQNWFKNCHTNGVELGLKELLYYKSKSRLLDLKPKGQIRSAQAGQYLAPHKGRGMEFAEVRQYQYGDDIRAIDWRVTARTGEAHTKLYQEEKERPVFIFTDLSNSMLFGSQLLLKSVQAAHLSALVAWSASQRGDRLGGVVFSEHSHHELKPTARDKGVLAFCHQLCDVHETSLANRDSASASRFNDNLKRLKHLAKPGSLIYLVSDFSNLNDESFSLLEGLSRHCELIGCQVSDPFEHTLPAYSQAIEIQGTQNTWTLPLSDKQFRDKFAKRAQQVFSVRLKRLQRAGMTMLNFSADIPLETQLTR